MWAKSLQSYLTLCCPMDYSPPGSSVHGIVQARILECVAISSSRGCFLSRDQTLVSMSPALAGGFFTTTYYILYMCTQLNIIFGKFLNNGMVVSICVMSQTNNLVPVSVQFSSDTQLCPTLCDPMDCCLPGASIHGIVQARILE